MISSQELYDAGYALPQYDISRVKRTWKYKDTIFTTPIDVKTLTLDGLPFPVLTKEQVDEWTNKI